MAPRQYCGDGSDPSRLGEIGSNVVALQHVPSIGSGYLTLSPRELVTIEYKGSQATADEGWFFGKSVATGFQGWFLASAVAEAGQNSGVRGMDVAGMIGATVKMSAAVPSPATGYLAVLAGEAIKVEYVGSRATDDEGWFYGRRSLATHTHGWVLTAAISVAGDKAPCVPELAVTVEAVTAPCARPSRPVPRDEVTPAECEPPPRARPSPPDGFTTAAGTAGEPPPSRPYPSYEVTPAECQPPVSHPYPSNEVKTAVHEPPSSRPSPSDKVTNAEYEQLLGDRSVASPSRSSVPSLPSGRAAASVEETGLRLLGACFPDRWEYKLRDVEKGCFVGFLPRALDQRQTKHCFDLVNEGMEELGWETPMKAAKGQKHMLRRLKWMTTRPCKCTYTYKAEKVDARDITVKPAHYPQFMVDLMDIVMPLCGLNDRSAWPNSCSLARYSPSDGLDWIADDEQLFQGTEQNCAIISLSLGAPRHFEVRRAADVTAKKGVCKFTLNGGDVCTMEGMTQRHYHYRVSKDGGARLNLTWRWIVAHDKGCGTSGG